MIVAMAAVRMVQMGVNQIVNMITVRHAFVPAAGTVYVAALVSSAGMSGRALRTILSVALENVLVNVILMHVMQMTVVEIVSMAVVLDGDVATARPVRVRMLFVRLAGHCELLSPSLNNRSSEQFAC